MSGAVWRLSVLGGSERVCRKPRKPTEAESDSTTMPAKSEAQRRKLNAKFGHAWVKKYHFDNPGKLPSRKRKGKRKHHTLAALTG